MGDFDSLRSFSPSPNSMILIPALNFRRIYEMDFPEDAHAIGFRGI
jgi:hypothetical protein